MTRKKPTEKELYDYASFCHYAPDSTINESARKMEETGQVEFLAIAEEYLEIRRNNRWANQGT